MRLERCGSRLRVLAAVPSFGSDKRADTLPVRQLPSASSLSRYMFPLFALLQTGEALPTGGDLKAVGKHSNNNTRH